MMGAIVTIDESNGSKITITLNDESLLMEVSRRVNRKLAIDLVDGARMIVDQSNSFLGFFLLFFCTVVFQWVCDRIFDLPLSAQPDHTCVSSANGP